MVEACHVTMRPHRWYRRWRFPDWVINCTLAPSSESYRLKESVPAEGGMRRIGDRAPAPAPSDLVQKVDAYLAAHVAQKVKLSELACDLNLSVSLVSHRYREETGLPPKKRLMRMRMDLVKKMLLSGQPLKAAAVAAGIPDPYYLSRVFKREEGLSPLAYRKQLQGTYGPGETGSHLESRI